MQKNYVQYGCGHSAPAGWLNFDSSPTLRLERLPLIGRFYNKHRFRFPSKVRYGDIVKGLPFPASSCAGIYCSHVLEHLSLNDFRIALRNTLDILEPHGIFRLVLPDLAYYCRAYMESSSDDAAIKFMRDTSLGHETRARRLGEIARVLFGNSQHLWMWDYNSIRSELENIGFVNVRRAEFGDSSDPAFNVVEEKDRWDNCVGLECRKYKSPQPM